MSNHLIDIVFCINCTNDMHLFLWDFQKRSVNIHNDVLEDLRDQQKTVDQLRIKIIGFRDYYIGLEEFDLMVESDFFELPNDKSDYSSFISNLKILKAGDEPSNALEAMAIAMKSDWNTADGRKRQVICMLTDASAHPLEKAGSGAPSQYPSDLPKTFDALADKWESEMDEKARRLVIFAPEAYPWSEICPDQGGFSDAIHYPLHRGDGLSDVEYKQIINLVANSI